MASLALPENLFAFIPFILLIIFFLILKWNLDGFIPWNWPLVGMTPTVAYHIHRVHDRMTEVLNQTGCTFLFRSLWFSNLDFLLTVDPSNIHHILSSNFERYPKGPDSKYIFDIFGDAIINSDFDSWKSKRRVAHSLVRRDNFLRFLEESTMKKVKEGVVSVLESVCENGSVLDFQDLFQRFSFDCTCMLVTGFDFNSLSIDFPQVPFSKAMDDVEEVIFLRHLIPKSLWELQKKLQIGQPKRLKEACEIIDQTIENLLALKRESLQKEEPAQGADLITSYMINDKLEEEDGNFEENDKFLRDTLLNFMIAGRDTVSSALSWFFFCVSNNPTVEAKIREELKSSIPKNEACDQWRIFSMEEVDKLVYFHGALCEALRLYPPIPLQHRVSTQHDTLPSGHIINPKTKLVFSLYALGRMRQVWGKDCEEFKPERWISEKGSIKHVPSYKFLAFNAGPRTCLGKQVAFTEMKMAAAAIIHNYNIIQELGHEVVPNSSIILHMKHGFKVKVTKRWS
ncbi:alkane hydroxylase MAH1-like [Momordica charantia]|uniref:Alkane hydroxylase MAH1-like n=1 Tax=Momordica charantia TaxID=3673 RepID=A0A6J1BTE8_MOMCH|nr:alkane hydroxylase MAH1-like [Momordica charantia]